MSTVADIQDGDAVRAFISNGIVVLDCKAVKVVRPYLRDGQLPYAWLNNDDADWWPLGGRFRGPSINLDHPVTRDADGTWLVAL